MMTVLRRYSERDLENYLCANTSHVLGESIEIIGRQITLEHGRLDLLTWDRDYGVISILELKARALAPKDVAQVLRYLYDVWEVLNSVMTTGLMECQMSIGFAQLWQDTFSPSWHGFDDHKILPVLIGTNIDEQTASAAFGAGCQIMIWGYDGADIWLSYVPPPIGRLGPKHLPPWAQTLNSRVMEYCADQEWNSARQLRHHTDIIDRLLTRDYEI